MGVDLSKLNFFSGVNYMKRDISSGTAVLTLGAYGSTVTQTVNHNLGYIPFYQVLTEQDATGKIWVPSKVNQYTDSSLGTDPPDIGVVSWITTTTLTINLNNITSPVASGARTIYWLIYKDYGTS